MEMPLETDAESVAETCFSSDGHFEEAPCPIGAIAICATPAGPDRRVHYYAGADSALMQACRNPIASTK